MDPRGESRVGVPGPNAPALDGARLSPTAYAAELLRGFTAAYELLVAHRDELLADGGPVAALARAQVRVIGRPTLGYYIALKRMRRAASLRDGADFALQQELVYHGSLEDGPRPPVWE